MFIFDASLYYVGLGRVFDAAWLRVLKYISVLRLVYSPIFDEICAP